MKLNDFFLNADMSDSEYAPSVDPDMEDSGKCFNLALK